MFLGCGALAMAGSMRMDGIRVYGRLQDVGRADIREAIDSSGANKPREIEVVSSNEMHAYYDTREPGWTPVRRLPSLASTKKNYVWTPWGLSIYEPQIL